MFLLSLQATKFTPSHVDERIESFINLYINDKLKNLSDEDFKTTIEALIKKRSEVDITLNDEFSRNWNEIFDQEYLFDRHERKSSF